MEKTFNKVNYSEYEGKYDEQIKEKMANAPESINIETMRANLYGYTFTKEYADGEIPDEFSMDYWEEYHFENDLIDEPIEIDLDSMLHEMELPLREKDPSPYLMYRLKRNCFLKPLTVQATERRRKRHCA